MAGGKEQALEPRLVRTDHKVRTASFAYCFAVIGAHLWHQDTGAFTWALFALQFLAYPHLVYWRAMRSANPNRAERDNLYLDSALLGAWCAFLGFPSWITFGMIGATLLNAAVNRGLGGVALSFACSAGGAVLWAAVGGLRYAPGTIDFVTGAAFVGALVYSTAVGLVVHRQNRRIAAAREALRASEERYRMIAENAADLIAMVDEHGRWLYTSPSYSRVLDERDLAPLADCFTRMHPDDAQVVRNAVARAAATGRARELSVRLVDRQGRLRTLKTRIQAVRDDAAPGAHDPRRVILVAHDVTDLRDSEERLLLAAHALEGMTEAIMIASADGTIQTVNRAFCEITGYGREDVTGQHESTTRSALQPASFYESVYRTVASEGYWSGTTWARRKNGSLYREWRSVRAVREPGGSVTHYVSVFYEVGAGKAAAANTPIGA